MALGSEEVSLLDLVGAYTVFPNLGEVVRPRLIRGIVASDGSLAYYDEPSRGRVASAPASYVVSHLLEGVIDEGTGRGVRRLGITRPVGGKTGTTNDERDAWFVGYSPDLVAGVWVGFDDGRPLGLTGGAAALPVWVALMQDIGAAYEPRSFPVPPGVVFKTVDRAAADYRGGCVDPMPEAFVAGTEPARDCDAPRMAAIEPPTPPQRVERAARRVAEPVVGTVRRFFRRLFGGD
jgi:membrane carboxypeptidase/penicillin-binding protein